MTGPGLSLSVRAALAGAAGVTWGVQVLDTAARTDVGALVSMGEGRTFGSASLGKILLLVEAARQFEAGSLAPAELLAPTEDDLVGDSGLWHHLLAGELPACDVAVLVGAFSDNQATNVLLRRLGVDQVAATAAAAGIREVALHRYVRAQPRAGDPPSLSTGTAAGYADLLRRLHRSEVLGQAVSGMVLTWLGLNADLSMVGGGLGLDPLAHTERDRGLMLWNKTGTVTGFRGDVGVVSGPESTLAYAVLAEWEDAGDPALRDEVLTAMHDVGRLLAWHVQGEG